MLKTTILIELELQRFPLHLKNTFLEPLVHSNFKGPPTIDSGLLSACKLCREPSKPYKKAPRQKQKTRAQGICLLALLPATFALVRHSPSE